MAFSLIELPAYSRSLQKARQIQGVNNVRELGQGLQEYVADSHQYPLFEDATISNGMPQNVETWITALGNQFGYDHRTKANFWNRDVWLCPGVKSTGILKQGFSSYGYNAFGIGTDTNSLGLGGTFGFAHMVSTGHGHSQGRFPIVKPAIPDSWVVNPPR